MIRNAYILAGKPKGRRPYERPIHSWQENIMDLKWIQGCEQDSTVSEQDPLADFYEHCNEPLGNFWPVQGWLCSIELVSFSLNFSLFLVYSE
jgi:hypothetical protein